MTSFIVNEIHPQYGCFMDERSIPTPTPLVWTDGPTYTTDGQVPCFAPFHVLLNLPLRVLRKKSSGLKESLEAMAGGHHGNGITYGGLTLHTTKGWHSRVGKGMCAMMWFWILYRAKQDGAVLLGWRHPWDHAHGHGHAESHEKAEHH